MYEYAIKYIFRDLSMTVSISSSKSSFNFHPNPIRTTYSNYFLHRRQPSYHQLLSLLYKSAFIEKEIPAPLAHVIADQEAFEDVANRLHPLFSAAESIYTAAKTWASMRYLLFTMILQVTNRKQRILPEVKNSSELEDKNLH